MTCNCETSKPTDPFRAAGFLPGVMACDGLTTSQSKVEDASTRERTQITNQLQGLRSRSIANIGAVQVWIGDANVTPTTGFPLPVNGGFTTEFAGAIYACTTPGDGDGLVSVWSEANRPGVC